MFHLINISFKYLLLIISFKRKRKKYNKYKYIFERLIIKKKH